MIALLVALLLLLPPIPASDTVQITVFGVAALPGSSSPIEGKYEVGVVVYRGMGKELYRFRGTINFEDGTAVLRIPRLPADSEIFVGIWERTKFAYVSGIPLPARGQALMGIAHKRLSRAEEGGIGVRLYGRFPHWDEDFPLLRGWVPKGFWVRARHWNSPTPLLLPFYDWVYNASMLVTVIPSILTPKGFVVPSEFWIIATPVFIETEFVTEWGSYSSLYGSLHVKLENLNETVVTVRREGAEQNITLIPIGDPSFGCIKEDGDRGKLWVFGNVSFPAFPLNLSSYPQLLDYRNESDALIPTGISAGSAYETVTLLGSVNLLAGSFPADARGVSYVVAASFRGRIQPIRGNNTVSISTPFGNVTVEDWKRVEAGGRRKSEIVGMAENGTHVLVEPVEKPLNVTVRGNNVTVLLSPVVPDAQGWLSVVSDGFSGRILLHAGEGISFSVRNHAVIYFEGDSFVYEPQRVLVDIPYEAYVGWSWDILAPLLAGVVLVALLRRFWGGVLGLR